MGCSDLLSYEIGLVSVLRSLTSVDVLRNDLDEAERDYTSLQDLTESEVICSISSHILIGDNLSVAVSLISIKILIDIRSSHVQWRS